MLRISVLILLFGAGLSLSTQIIRNQSIPGLVSLERQIWKDWENLKSQNPELDDLGEIQIQGSSEGGISKVWATEARLDCYAKDGGQYGAEFLLIPVDTEQGPAANVQLYLYDLKSGEFVKEIARLYEL